MQALLFEMEPRRGHEDHYFRHAAKLRPLVLAHEGLLFLERYKSLARPDIILSHSVWRDEASIAKWRTDRAHRRSQIAGRFEHFQDYRIRIAHVMGSFEPGVVPKSWSSENAYSDPDKTSNQFIVISRSDGAIEKDGGETFSSVTHPGSFLRVEAVEDEQAARAEFSRAQAASAVTSVLIGRVSRDYGMFDRGEAPQYFEAVER